MTASSQSNTRVDPQPSDLNLHMFSMIPENHGIRDELAEAPEQPGNTWRLLLAVATVVLLSVLSVRWAMYAPAVEMSPTVEPVPTIGTQQTDRIAVGDMTLAVPELSAHPSSGEHVIALDLPRKPLPGQAKPDAHGRCPGKTQVVRNGACWFDVDADPDDCKADGGYMVQDRCYLPAYPPQRQPTSTPQDSR
jgi:hypothetical protein